MQNMCFDTQHWTKTTYKKDWACEDKYNYDWFTYSNNRLWSKYSLRITRNLSGGWQNMCQTKKIRQMNKSVNIMIFST